MPSPLGPRQRDHSPRWASAIAGLLAAAAFDFFAFGACAMAGDQHKTPVKSAKIGANLTARHARRFIAKRSLDLPPNPSAVAIVWQSAAAFHGKWSRGRWFVRGYPNPKRQRRPHSGNPPAYASG